MYLNYNVFNFNSIQLTFVSFLEWKWMLFIIKHEAGEIPLKSQSFWSPLGVKKEVVLSFETDPKFLKSTVGFSFFFFTVF